MASGWWDLWGSVGGCIIAHTAIGASSYLASKYNAAKNGSGNSGDGSAFPTFNVSRGWVHDAASSQHIASTNHLNGLTNFSFILALKRTGLSGNGGYYGTGAGGAADLIFCEQTRMFVRVNGTAAQWNPATAVALNAVDVRAITRRGSAVTFFVNGAVGVTGTTGTTATSYSNPVDVGKVVSGTGGSTSYFTGAILGYAAYSVALPVSAVRLISSAAANLPRMSAYDVMHKYLPRAAASLMRRTLYARAASRGVSE